jgi:hypothetical protein
MCFILSILFRAGSNALIPKPVLIRKHTRVDMNRQSVTRTPTTLNSTSPTHPRVISDSSAVLKHAVVIHLQLASRELRATPAALCRHSRHIPRYQMATATSALRFLSMYPTRRCTHVVVVVQQDIAQPTANENAAPNMFVVRYIPVF